MNSYQRRHAAAIALGYTGYSQQRRIRATVANYPQSFQQVFHGRTVKQVEQAGGPKLLATFAAIWADRDKNGIPTYGTVGAMGPEAELGDFYDDYRHEFPADDASDIFDAFWSGPTK